LIALILFLAAFGNAPDKDFGYELPVIRCAAARNGIEYGSDDWYILLAIRLAENGRAGREFGIMNPKAHNLDLQAGWCAATIKKNRARWEKAGKPGSFIAYLGGRYCPKVSDPTGHRNWKNNVVLLSQRLMHEGIGG
jgi:hypothetical protein